MTDVAVLTASESATLQDCEQRIERGLKTFIEVGQALAEIRDSRLYKGTHDTFEAYCQERWQIDRTRAQNFITAARTVLEISNTHPDLPAPVKESQARALAAVPEPDRAEVWRETVERTEGKPTAAAVRAVQRERTPFPGPVGAVTAPPADPGTTTPPPGSPATWTDEQREANQREIDGKRMREAGQKAARNLLLTVRGEISTVVSAVDLGEKDLITEQLIADLRAAVDLLASRLEASK